MLFLSDLYKWKCPDFNGFPEKEILKKGHNFSNKGTVLQNYKQQFKKEKTQRSMCTYIVNLYTWMKSIVPFHTLVENLQNCIKTCETFWIVLKSTSFIGSWNSVLFTSNTRDIFVYEIERAVRMSPCLGLFSYYSQKDLTKSICECQCFSMLFGHIFYI